MPGGVGMKIFFFWIFKGVQQKECLDGCDWSEIFHVDVFVMINLRHGANGENSRTSVKAFIHRTPPKKVRTVKAKAHKN